jgi:Lipase (class 3)
MAPPGSTLECRLACASSCAYVVSAGKTTLDPQAAAPYYDGVGFKAPPATFYGGIDNINACQVGTTVDGVVVAFRGTLSIDGPFTLQKLLDWTNDLNAALGTGVGLPGQVHQGFLGSLNSLWVAVEAEARNQLTLAGAGTPLIITGHSKGGGIAPLAAMRFWTQDQLKAKVITFAAPKPGNKAFADAYDALIDDTRYEFAEDIVPHLPPSADFLNVLAQIPFLRRELSGLQRFNYQSVGSLMYIPRTGNIVPDPQNSLLDQRRLRLLNLILRGHIQQIEDDHRIACGYGYMTALCPSGVCPLPL